MTRRGFVKLSAFTAGVAAMAGTARSSLVEAKVDDSDAAGTITKIRTMCRACLNNCGRIVHVRYGKVIKRPSS